MVLLILLLLISPAYSMEDSIGAVFHNAPAYAQEYHGQKERWRPQTNDPEVLVSNHGGISEGVSPKPMPSFSAGETTIQKLDRLIKSLVYDPTAKTFSSSRTPEDVISEHTGNCFEIGKLAFQVLSKEGYNTHLVNIKTRNSQDWHTICVFQELDGGWSYFQAADKLMGFFPVNAPSVEALVKSQFDNLVDVKVIL